MIEVLSPQVANMIAAGEVVERPASALKELLENAVDAGATAVTAEIKRGGISMIRVTDNGAGMDAADAARAFMRHATSKLRTAEDLQSVLTMGFRGEALAAIAGVSRVELLTRKRGAAAGTSLTLEAGAVTAHSEAGCPEGTTIIVRDLFFNTPARQKFLKKDNTEAAAAQEAAVRTALSRPELSVRFIRDGSQTLHTPGDGDLKNCLYSVFGRDFTGALLPLGETHEQIRVSGFIGSPQISRGSRTMQYFLVAKRPVRSRILTAALEEAFGGALMTGRFPVCCLHIGIAPEVIDVNVHPAKSEIKFSDERAVFDAVYRACKDALRRGGVAPAVQIRPYTPAGGRVPVYGALSPSVYTQTAVANQQSPAPTASAPAADSPHAAPQPPATPVSPLPPAADSAQRAAETIPPQIREPAASSQEETANPTAQDNPAGWRLIGEAMSGYLLVETPDALWIIDKHAAHERLLYNRLKAGERPFFSQQLIAPKIIALTQPELDALTGESAFIEETGFELDTMGPGTLAVRAAPGEIDESELPALLSELASLLRDKRRPELREEALCLVACKAAVKLGRSSNREDMEHLAGLVMETPDLRHCPHGRPVALRLTRGELYKQFGR
ncbi:MAG: DNA mismatch repair endonuclease MutL [Oscillospiraceae bacterium]|jgi:DNA mismatch repair protein MutL|nr:DNA mismatch repair endonuclease MutL [Oscillospiraceae bacterium]